MHLLAIVQDAMLEHGFELSYGVGKTAVMFSYHGKRSTEARQQMEKACPTGIPLVSEFKGRIIIPDCGTLATFGRFHHKIWVKDSRAQSAYGCSFGKVETTEKISNTPKVGRQAKELTHEEHWFVSFYATLWHHV